MRLPSLVLLVSSLVGGESTLARAAGEALGPDFSLPGPCTPVSWRTSLPIPPELRTGGLPASLPLNVTRPTCPAGAVLPFGAAPFPVLFFYNGFMNVASWYWRLVQAAASWGVVCVQYDTPRLALTTVAAEVALVPELAKWVGDQSDDPSSPLYSQADVGRLCTAGHSRGGKLASLALTTYPELVKAAFLVDPVDASRYSPESAANPSAVRALAASGREVGIAAASLTGSCNPADGNYLKFFAAAGNGSWLEVVKDCGHAQFADAGCLTNAAADLLCGRGKASRAAVARLTSPPMLAWLWSQLEGQEAASSGSASPSPLPAFFGWVQQQEAAGKLEFEVKGEEEAALWAAAAEAEAVPPGEQPPAEEEQCEQEAAQQQRS